MLDAAVQPSAPFSLACDAASAVATCLHCGGPETCELFEVWDGHEFQIETCCERLHEEIVEEMDRDPAFAKALMERMQAGELCGQDLRRVASEDGQMLLDWKLEVEPVDRRTARDFVREHHEHCPPPAGDRFRAAIYNGPTLVGVVIVGRPVARALPQYSWVEVNRLCVRRDLPAALRWNACSQLYGWAAREARKRGMERIVTYTLESEQAVTLKAAGWDCEGTVGRHGKSWNSPSRPREDKTPTVPKQRWSRRLDPPPRAVAAREAADAAARAEKEACAARKAAREAAAAPALLAA